MAYNRVDPRCVAQPKQRTTGRAFGQRGGGGEAALHRLRTTHPGTPNPRNFLALIAIDDHERYIVLNFVKKEGITFVLPMHGGVHAPKRLRTKPIPAGNGGVFVARKDDWSTSGIATKQARRARLRRLR